jgi:hypothetical protein
MNEQTIKELKFNIAICYSRAMILAIVALGYILKFQDITYNISLILMFILMIFMCVYLAYNSIVIAWKDISELKKVI